MDSHTAHVFVKDALFLLTGLAVTNHLWDLVSVSEAGLDAKGMSELARQLGIRQEGIRGDMTLNELSDKVTQESVLDVKVVKIPFFAF